MNTQSNLFTQQSAGESFSAPLGDWKQAQLEIANGISNFELAGDPSLRDLFHAEFSGIIPDVRARAERVLIRYRRSAVGWFLHELLRGSHDGKVVLNTSLPWRIDLRGGVSHLDADLRKVQLSSLSITGGVSEADVLLPRPAGTIQIHIASGVSNLRIFHPQGVAARLKVGGGISQLAFQDQSYGSIGDGIDVQTAEYKTASNRYDIVVSGGVSNLAVRAQA